MIILVLAMSLVPIVRQALHTAALDGVQWAMVVAGAALGSSWIEIRKWIGSPDARGAAER